MSDPKVAGNKPVCETAKPGEYWWCACGHSKTQPFCDGSHKGTEFKPFPVSINSDQQVAWCMCKQTATPPFCDGSHKKIGPA